MTARRAGNNGTNGTMTALPPVPFLHGKRSGDAMSEFVVNRVYLVNDCKEFVLQDNWRAAMIWN